MMIVKSLPENATGCNLMRNVRFPTSQPPVARSTLMMMMMMVMMMMMMIRAMSVQALVRPNGQS